MSIPVIEVNSWDGERRDSFVKLLRQILLPVVKTNIILSVPHGYYKKPIIDENFYVWIWSAASGEKKTKMKKIINNITVDCADDCLSPTSDDIVIYDDEGWPVAGLQNNNLYIFHDACHYGSENEFKLFGWILERAAEKIRFSFTDEKIREIIEKEMASERDIDSSELAPNGMTKKELFHDISLALDPKFEKMYSMAFQIRLKYKSYKDINELIREASRSFNNKFWERDLFLIEHEVSAYVRQAKQLKMNYDQFFEPLKKISGQSYYPIFFDYAAKLNIFTKINDYLFFYKKAESEASISDDTVTAIKNSIFKLLKQNNGYNLENIYEVYKCFKHELSSTFYVNLREKAKNITKYATLGNLRTAKIILGSEFTQEMQDLLEKLEEKRLRKIYNKVNTRIELIKAMMDNQEKRAPYFTEQHLRIIVGVIKHLEFELGICSDCRNVIKSYDESNLFIEILAKEHIFTKPEELIYLKTNIINGRPLLQSAKSAYSAINELSIEYWKRRFDHIVNSCGLGRVITALNNENVEERYAEFLVNSFVKLGFTIKAFCRFLKKYGIKDELFVLIVVKLVDQKMIKNWEEVQYIHTLIVPLRTSEKVISILKKYVLDEKIIDKKSSPEELDKADMIFGLPAKFKKIKI